VLNGLKKHRFTEISVDFVWMPEVYLHDTVLRDTFFSVSLPILFASVWLSFLEKYRGGVKVHHGYEYIAFVMRECNGAPLLVETMQQILDLNNERLIATMLAASSPALYIFLSQEMRRVYGRKQGLICSDAPRWQNVDTPLWQRPEDDLKTGIYVDFVTKQLWLIGTSKDPEICAHARVMICSHDDRKKAEQ
jgi:hypothetical protein